MVSVPIEAVVIFPCSTNSPTTDAFAFLTFAPIVYAVTHGTGMLQGRREICRWACFLPQLTYLYKCLFYTFKQIQSSCFCFVINLETGLVFKMNQEMMDAARWLFSK